MNHPAEAVGGRLEVVALERADARLVNRERFVKGRAAGRGRRSGRFCAASGTFGAVARTPAAAAVRAGTLSFFWDFDGFEAFSFDEGFDTFARFDSFSAFGALELDFLAAGRPIDRLAAARRCFGMQS